jgi:hypothetical protein
MLGTGENLFQDGLDAIGFRGIFFQFTPQEGALLGGGGKGKKGKGG